MGRASPGVHSVPQVSACVHEGLYGEPDRPKAAEHAEARGGEVLADGSARPHAFEEPLDDKVEGEVDKGRTEEHVDGDLADDGAHGGSGSEESRVEKVVLPAIEGAEVGGAEGGEDEGPGDREAGVALDGQLREEIRGDPLDGGRPARQGERGA